MSQFDRVPASLRAIPSWLVWRLTHIAGEKKPRKIPYYVNGAKRSGVQGSDEDRAQLTTFDKARAACERGDFSGIGFAVMPDLNVVALDFDDVVVDGKVNPRVLRVIAGTYAELSPSGNGVRAFFSGVAASKKDLAGDPKVEVFGTNGFVTVTGNQLPEHEMMGWDDMVPTTEVCGEFLADRFGGELSTLDDDLFSTLKPPLDLTPEEIQRTLAALPADMAYDDWVKVGMACHHQGLDFEVWHDWSRRSPKYTTREYAWDRWRSFGKGRSSITFAWVIKQAGVKLQREAVDATKSYRQMIAEVGDEFELRTRVATLIRGDERLQSIDRAMLAQALQERFAALGAKLPIADVRKLLQRSSARVDSLPDWAQGWVYVATEDKFLRVGTEVWVTKSGFDSQFTRHMPRGEGGQVVKQASAAVLEDLGMPTVERALYVPWADLMFEYEGQTCVNRYRKESAPTEADSSDGVEAAVVKHIEVVCGGRQLEVRTLIQWLAWNVQNPGKKVRWSPVIKGVEGDGKSVLGELLQGVMGPSNVRQISPSVIGTDFTGWAEGACVGLLEEIKLTGHNKFDVLNKLKPYITNSTVEVHRKGRDTYNAHNTQNYIAFTNHADALPIGDTDRRWYVIFTPWASSSEFEAHVGPLKAYFNRLFAVIHGEPARLRRWLLDVDMTGFEPNAAAPATDEKAEMVALSVSDEEDTVREVIEAGGEGIGQEVLSSPLLVAQLRGTGIDLRSNSLNRMLVKLGWSKVPERIKWRGMPHRVWTRGGANVLKTAHSVRRALDCTVPSSGCDDLF